MRNSRSASRGVPFTLAHIGKEIKADCPTLVEIDDAGNEVPSLPMQPRMNNVPGNAPFRYDNLKTVKEDSILFYISDNMYHWEGDKIYNMLEASKRGPHCPS